jgi:ABC-type phosphate transport system substrate-binding protein
VGFLTMARRLLPLLALLGLVTAVLLALAPRPVRAGNDVALAIIVSPSSKLTNLSVDDLRRVFQSERLTDPDGNRLIALNHPPKTVDRVGFDQVVLGMDAEAVGRFWIDRKIRGGSGPPRTVESLATLRRVVEKLPGAIGYIRPAQLSNEIKVIRIDGKLPEDQGYPLRYRP